MAVTVGSVTVMITDYRPKQKNSAEIHSNNTNIVSDSSDNSSQGPLNSHPKDASQQRMHWDCAYVITSFMFIIVWQWGCRILHHFVHVHCCMAVTLPHTSSFHSCSLLCGSDAAAYFIISFMFIIVWQWRCRILHHFIHVHYCVAVTLPHTSSLHSCSLLCGSDAAAYFITSFMFIIVWQWRCRILHHFIHVHCCVAVRLPLSLALKPMMVTRYIFIPRWQWSKRI